ncbi:MAG: IS200/IS605 family transposase [Acidobacteriales bacterium]|nr:IS200/IS605 family transposase [Terriglobales bacterium]
MAHSFTSLKSHIIFSTAGRRRLIREELQPELWAYMVGVARNYDFLLMKVGGVEDHCHLLIETQPSLAVAKAVQVIKANSSRWRKRHVAGFEWQRKYAGFSVSQSMTAKTIAYIANQKEHHRRRTFDEELKELLRLNGVTIGAEGFPD